MDNPLDSSFDPAFHVAKSYRRQCRDYDLSLLGAPPPTLHSREPGVAWRPVSGRAHPAPPPPPPNFGACSPDPDDGDEGDGDPLAVWRGLWNCCGALGVASLLYWAAFGLITLYGLLKGH